MRISVSSICHASHRRSVDEGYWVAFYYPLETHATADDHGFVSIVDSWAEFMAMTYSHRYYGNEANFGTEKWED